MYKSLLILVFTLFYTCIFSQINLNRDTTLKVSENGVFFKAPFIGGINSAQFSEIDLNLDGVLDLVIFDRSGNKITPLINLNGNYIFAPEYREKFPKIHDWILLEDYNCDGKNDIYTYSTAGIAIYKNTSTNQLSFNLETPLVMSNYGNNNLNLYVSPVDIPAITDIDYDGDLDILTFSILGGFIEFHKNNSMELTGSCDTIAFELSESCWGLFYEGLNDYILNCPNCQCPSISSDYSSKSKHAGSTLCAIDIDNDNDKEIILGDVSFSNLNLLSNGGNNQNALMISVDSIFPQNNNNTSAVNLDFFPATYYIDVTNDGIKDLIVTTNSENNSENFNSVWLYSNIGQNTEPVFIYQTNNFIQNDMIDLGTGAYPTFFDYNNDGLLDLIIGNYGYHNVNNNPSSSLALFENTGTNNVPEYELIDRDWLALSSLNLNTTLNMPSLNLYPTFGDMNGDGYKDLIIGDSNGKIHYFENNPLGQFQLVSANYFNIDVGYFAHPQIIDLNRDGKNDIIIGEQDGTINFCPNNGTNTNPNFDTIITNLGNIKIEDSLTSTGFSTPKIVEVNGEYELFSGSYSGKIYQFNNIENNLSGTFNMINSVFTNEWDGGKSAISLADINNDDDLDMFIGNISGGISFFSSDSSMINSINYLKNQVNLFYPNPTNDNITVSNSLVKKITIIDMQGKIVYFNENLDPTHKIDVSFLKKGIYVIKYNDWVDKLIIK